MKETREGTQRSAAERAEALARGLQGISSPHGLAEALGRFFADHRVVSEALLLWPLSEEAVQAWHLLPGWPPVLWRGHASAFAGGTFPAFRGPSGPLVPFASGLPRRLDLLPSESSNALLFYRAAPGAGDFEGWAGAVLRLTAGFVKKFSILSTGKAQWEKAFDAASEVFVLHETGGRIFRANLALSRMAGRPIRECVGLTCGELLPGLCTPFDAVERDWTDPATGRRYSVTTQWINLEGEEAALHVLKDVTEERRLLALEAEQKQLDFTRNLLQGVAHEIRNPIFAVQTLLQAMTARGIGGEAALPFTDRALAEVQRLDAVVRRFLQLAFLEDGTEAERTSLENLLEEAWREAARQTGEGSLPILSLAPEVRRTFVRVHRRSFTLALTEIFANAVAFSPSGASVHCGAGREDSGRLRIEIRDLGPGVDEAAAGRIFEPFFTTRPRRTGLGLVLARAAVKREGGDLSLGTCPAGSPGALFLVRLPKELEESGEKGP